MPWPSVAIRPQPPHRRGPVHISQERRREAAVQKARGTVTSGPGAREWADPTATSEGEILKGYVKKGAIFKCFMLFLQIIAK